jgi:hypothetical protein
MLTVTYAECHIKAPYAECHYAECHYAEYRYAECHGALIIPISMLCTSLTEYFKS